MKRISWIILITFVLNISMFTLLMGKEKVPVPVPKTHTEHLQFLIDSIWQAKFLIDYTPETYLKVVKSYMGFVLPPPPALIGAVPVYYLIKFVKGAWNIIKGTFGKLYHSRYAFSHMKHSTWGYVFELFKGGIMIVVGEIATHTVALLTVTTGVGAAANVAIFLSMLYVDKWISMVESKKGVVDYHLLSKEYSFSKSDYWNLFYSFPNAITSDLVETGHIGKCLNDKSFNYFMSFDKHIDDFEQFVETKQISIFNQRTKVDGQMSKAMKKLQQSSSNITTANMSNIKNSRRKLRRLKSISAKLKNQAHHLKSYKSLLKEQAKISRKMKKIYDPIGKSVRGYMKGATRAGKNTLLTSVGNADQFVRKSKDLKRLNRLNNNLRLSMGKITRNHLDDFLKKSRNCKKFIMKSNKLTRGLAKLSKYKSRVTAIAKGLKNKIPDIIGIALDTIDWMDIAPPTLETSMLTDEADGIGLNFAKNNLFEGTFYLKDSGCGINTKSFELKIDNDKQFFNRYDDLEKAVVVRNKKLNYFEINESFASRFVRLEDQFKLVEAKFKIKNPVKDKVYDFSVFVRDRAGHPSQILKFKSKIVDDNTPPKIEFIEPKPFSEYKPGSPVNIKISLIEKESMIDWRKIKLKLYSKSTISQNDMIIPLRKTNFIKADFLDNRKFDYYFRNGLIELTMPSGFKREKGIYTIKIESENAAGVSSEEEVSFFVGNLNPVQFIPHFYPESMEYLPESEISFGYTVLNTLGEGSSIKEVKIELGQLPKGMELKSSKKTVSASNIITSYDFLKSQPFKFVLNKNVVRGLHYIPFTARFKINSLEKQILLKVEIKIQEKVGNVRSYLETDVSFETREGDVRPLPKGTRIFVNQIYKFPSYGMPKNIEQNIGEGLVLNDNGFVRIEITPVYPGKKKRLRIVAQAMLYDFIPAKVQSKSRRLIGAVVHRGRQPYKCIAEYQRVAPARSPLRGVILNKMPAVIIPCHGLKEVGILIPWEGELSTGGFINYGSPLMSSFSSSIGGNLKNFSENLRGGMNTTPGLYYKNHNGALEIISTLRKCFEQASKFYMLSRVLANNSGRFIPVIVEKDSLQQGEGDTVPSVSTIETEETNEEIDEKEYYEKKARLQKYASEVIIDDISDEEDEDTSEEIDEKLSSNSSVYRFLLTYPKEGIISEYIFNDSYFYKSRVFRNGFSSPKWAAYLSENVMIVCDSDDNKVKAITQYGSLIWEVSFNALPVKAYMLSSGTVCVLTSDSRLSLCTTGGDIFKSFAGPYKDITLTSDSSQIIALGNTEIQILNDVDQNVKTIPIGITADKISGNEDCIYVSDGSKVLKIKSGEKEVYSGAVSNIFNIYGDELCFVEDSKKIFRKPEKQKYCIFSDSGAFNSISGMFSFGFPRTKEKDDKEKIEHEEKGAKKRGQVSH
ncbi:hypothetical protein KAJ27_12415 [bacterium]|nr:hypothetical protein [bacterium]